MATENFPDKIRNSRVLVVGLGKSGLGAVRLLAGLGAQVAACDDKPASELSAAAELRDLGVEVYPMAAESYQGQQFVIQSPGIALERDVFLAARAAGATVMGELELASYFLQGPNLAITGSNGKTTTTALIGHILRSAGLPCQVGGNIGVAPAAMVATSAPEKWNVLELSSFQLETISKFRAQIALVLNITPDHLDRHKTMDRYISAKARLVETQLADGVCLLNAQNAESAKLASRTSAKVHLFNTTQVSAKDIALVDGTIYLFGQPLLAENEIPLRGRHNTENVMAAAGAAALAGVAPEAIAAAVKTFPGVEHRIEFVRELAGVKYFNDSKATNVDATEKAIDAFAEPLWLLLGGRDKKSNYRTLISRLLTKAKGILLVGEAAPIIRQQFEDAGATLPLVDCGTVAQAVAYAHQHAQSGEVVLLAPACASFDQFQSYEHRGRHFKETVLAL